MNAARAGRSVAGLAARRAGTASRQVANKTTSSKGKGVVGAPKTVAHETVTPPLASTKPPQPAVAHETVTPPLAKKEVTHETLTPKLAGGVAGGAGAGGGPPSAKKSSNTMIGLVLVGAVAASYYVTIHKMKDQDFLGDAEKEAAEEAQVNLHKSGLKVSNKVVPEQVEQAFNKASDVVSKAAKKVEDTVKSAVGEVKGSASEAKEEATKAAEAAAAAAKDEQPKKKGWRKYIIFGPRREG